MKAPAQLLTRAAQGQQQRTQGHKRQHHTGGVGQAADPVRTPVFGVAGEAHHLDGQHRKHAGHQVQDQPANQGAQHGGPQAQGHTGIRLRCVGVGLQGGGQSG